MELKTTNFCCLLSFLPPEASSRTQGLYACRHQKRNSTIYIHYINIYTILSEAGVGLGFCEAKQVGVFAKETSDRLTTLNKSLQFCSRCCCSCCCIYFNYSRKAQSHTFYWKNEHKEKTQSNNNNYYSITSKNFQFIFGCNFTHTHSYICQCDL